MSSTKTMYKFHGEVVHSFEIYLDATEESNGYILATGEEKLNHSYSGTMDGGNAMPELKSTGHYTVSVIFIKVHESSASNLCRISHVIHNLVRIQRYFWRPSLDLDIRDAQGAELLEAETLRYHSFSPFF